MSNLKVATSNEIKIETGVPMPPEGWGSNNKYPWDKLEIGQSFVFPGGVNDNAARAAAKSASLKRGARFVVKARKGVLRCWRTE